MRDVFRGLGIRVNLAKPENFLKCMETLTRMGLQQGDNVLEQVCFILHKRGEYAIMHFREMQILDGISHEMSEQEEDQLDFIASRLAAWDLVLLQDDMGEAPDSAGIRIIAFADKDKWELRPLYVIGKKKK